MKTRTYALWIVCGCLAALPPTAIAQGLPPAFATEGNCGPGPKELPAIEGPFPNSSLPPEVKAKDGIVTLFADHLHPQAKGIPLYIVNRSGEGISFANLGRAPGIVLEGYDEAAQAWRTTQAAGPLFVTCGTGFAMKVLKPGEHFKTLGYQPSDGRKGKVRFRMNSGDIASNAGAGVWSEVDAANVPLDQYALEKVPFAGDIALLTVPWEQGPDGRADFGPALARLELMQEWEDGKVFRVYAAYLKDRIKARPGLDGKEIEAVQVIDSLLSKEPKSGVHEDAFFMHCLGLLKGPLTEAYGSPGRYPAVVWEALAWLQSRKNDVAATNWRKAHDLMQSRLPAASGEERRAMSRLSDAAGKMPGGYDQGTQ